MHDFPMKTLGDLSHIRAGHAFRTKLDNDPTANTCVLQMKDIEVTRGITWSSVVKCQPVAIKRDWLSAGDILLVARGARNLAYYLIEDPPRPTLAAPHFFHISLTPQADELILAEFLAWQLNQQPVQDYFKRNAEGSTSKSIRRAVVEETPLFIPPLQQQTAIVGLQQTLNRERLLAETLITNGEKLMTQICVDLAKRTHEVTVGYDNE